MDAVIEKIRPKKSPAGVSVAAILTFFGSLILCSVLIIATIFNRLNVEKLQIEQLILLKTLRINDVISKVLYRTNSLSALVIHGGGAVYDFQNIAPFLIDHPAILNVLIAPDGIVSYVFPHNGNEALIGQDLFSDGNIYKEALTARDTGTLILSGPFNCVNAGQVLTGMLPVYIDTSIDTSIGASIGQNESGQNNFWGFVLVTVRFPDALTDAELGILSNHGYAYELWRINPVTDERLVLAGDYTYAGSDARYIEKHVPVFNADWYLKVWPIRNWYSYPENIILLIAGFLVSFLVFFVMQHNYILNAVKLVLENEAKTDPLTGVYNRRYFKEIAKMNFERARRLKLDGYIILFDLDRFKSINDTHGHVIGDKVLIEATSRLKAQIRPYDLFARYGGEEFIIYASDIDKENITKMAERLRLCLCEKVFKFGELTFFSSASFGIANIHNHDIENTILHADEALYTAKREGRNRIVFWNETGDSV